MNGIWLAVWLQLYNLGKLPLKVNLMAACGNIFPGLNEVNAHFLFPHLKTININ